MQASIKPLHAGALAQALLRFLASKRPSGLTGTGAHYMGRTAVTKTGAALSSLTTPRILTLSR